MLSLTDQLIAKHPISILVQYYCIGLDVGPDGLTLPVCDVGQSYTFRQIVRTMSDSMIREMSHAC